MISRQKVAVGEGIHIAGGTWVGGETLYQCNKISFPAQEPDICMFLLLLPWAWSHKTLHDPAVLSVACQKQEISSHRWSRCCRRWLTRILPTSSSAASWTATSMSHTNAKTTMISRLVRSFQYAGSAGESGSVLSTASRAWTQFRLVLKRNCFCCEFDKNCVSLLLVHQRVLKLPQLRLLWCVAWLWRWT